MPVNSKNMETIRLGAPHHTQLGLAVPLSADDNHRRPSLSGLAPVFVFHTMEVAPPAFRGFTSSAAPPSRWGTYSTVPVYAPLIGSPASPRSALKVVGSAT